jgi:hypothetical protein
MTWTFDPTLLAGSPLFQLRSLIGDTLASDPQIADEELAFYQTQRASLYGAAAMACRTLASKYSRSVTQASGTTKFNFTDLSKAYAARAVAFELMASAGMMPYAGGISIADKAAQELDPDRVGPQFNIGMDDNEIPVAPEGNETETTSPVP